MESRNSVRQKDIEELAKNKIFEDFQAKTIMVTGATGLIGSEIVLSLLCANRIQNLNIQIVALVRNMEKAKTAFERVLTNPNLTILEQDIINPIKYSESVDYIIHTASTTSSKDFITYPVETLKTIIDGTRNVLEFAKNQVRESILYLSSLEVYGILNTGKLIKEEDQGYLDQLSPRSSYSLGKRLGENLCISYAKEFNINVKIARLTQTFGAGVEEKDNRVFAQFLKSAINKEDIILHTKGETIRNYCYLTDSISGLMYILSKGSYSEAYNVANIQTTISIKELAELIASRNNISVKYNIDNINRGYNPTVQISLDSHKLSDLGWEPLVDLEEMLERTKQALSIDMKGSNTNA